MPHSREGWNFHTGYLELPEILYRRVDPTPVAAPRLLALNGPLCAELGLDAEALREGAGLATLAGNAIPPGSTPLAQAYAGHQFGHFTMLGDGRAILMGEQIAPDGRRWDIQWKGSGRTPFSRGGDGRAAVGPMLREYLVSEALHALGIPTTRSLAVVATGETVLRDGPLPGAVLVRVASSHLRVGTLEFASALGDSGALKTLIEYTNARHGIPAGKNPARALLEACIQRQSRLVAEWMGVGFVHGVMNTDNMALSGETIDYGPCAFVDRFRSDAVFSSIDRHGRYAYRNQPSIAAWNLARLAEAVLPAWTGDHPLEEANECLRAFESTFQEAWLSVFRRKFGLRDSGVNDAGWIEQVISEIESAQADWTNTFHSLAGLVEDSTAPQGLPGEWCREWRARLKRSFPSTSEAVTALKHANPAVVPRNLAVESVLENASRAGELAGFHALFEAVTRPFVADNLPADWLLPPPAGTPPYRTFCGT